MKKLYISTVLVMIMALIGCRNSSNPNDTGGSEIDEPIGTPYDSGHEPSNIENTAITDSTQSDSADNP